MQTDVFCGHSSTLYTPAYLPSTLFNVFTMLSNSFRTAFAVSSFLSMTTYASAQTMASPSPVSGLRAIQFSGCFSSSYPLQDMGSYTFQSSGACQNECGAQNKPVMGLTSGTNCFCGDQLPPSDSKVDDTDCNTPCAGYNKEFCTLLFR